MVTIMRDEQEYYELHCSCSALEVIVTVRLVSLMISLPRTYQITAGRNIEQVSEADDCCRIVQDTLDSQNLQATTSQRHQRLSNISSYSSLHTSKLQPHRTRLVPPPPQSTPTPAEIH